MEPNTTTYKAMYEGSMIIKDPAHPTMEPYVDYSSTYYNESIGFDISTTHKLAQDRPTVVISIPCATLGIDIPDKSVESAEADFCSRNTLMSSMQNCITVAVPITKTASIICVRRVERS